LYSHYASEIIYKFIFPFNLFYLNSFYQQNHWGLWAINNLTRLAEEIISGIGKITGLNVIKDWNAFLHFFHSADQCNSQSRSQIDLKTFKPLAVVPVVFGMLCAELFSISRTRKLLTFGQ